MASFIAEEKEKNTMGTLMLPSVSPWEFLVGKAALILIIGMINTAAVFFIIGVDSQFLAANLLTYFPPLSL
jgi:ABC-2 type transport system permease protein